MIATATEKTENRPRWVVIDPDEFEAGWHAGNAKIPLAGSASLSFISGYIEGEAGNREALRRSPGNTTAMKTQE